MEGFFECDVYTSQYVKECTECSLLSEKKIDSKTICMWAPIEVILK